MQVYRIAAHPFFFSIRVYFVISFVWIFVHFKGKLKKKISQISYLKLVLWYGDHFTTILGDRLCSFRVLF